MGAGVVDPQASSRMASATRLSPRCARPRSFEPSPAKHQCDQLHVLWRCSWGFFSLALPPEIRHARNGASCDR